MATVALHPARWLHKRLEKSTKRPAGFFVFFFPLNVHNTKSKARSEEALWWRQEYAGEWVQNSEDGRSKIHLREKPHQRKSESWEVMRSFARADRKQQRQKALLTHPKPLNPRPWPLGARKCSNVGINSRRADWCGYYTAGRLPRWGDTAAPATPASINYSVTTSFNEINGNKKIGTFPLQLSITHGDNAWTRAHCTVPHWIRPGRSLTP